MTLAALLGGGRLKVILIVFRTVPQDEFGMIHPRAVTPLEMGDGCYRRRSA